MTPFRRSAAGLVLVLACFCPTKLYADVGLILETPTGLLGFLSNVGHVSVWISHGCLGARGRVEFCEESTGIVLTSAAYWPNPGAAAIPAELFFLGSQPGPSGRDRDAWTTSLAAMYPAVKPELGRKYMGRVWRRSVRVLTFRTTAEEDRRVLALVEQQRQGYHYTYSGHNCAFYAEGVLKLYLGPEFHADHVLDFGIDTPRALERALRRRLELEPDAVFRTVRFHDSAMHSWRQPPRNICETAIFDPKYALPLLLYQPYIYMGFGACYGATRLTETVWGKHTHTERGGEAAATTAAVSRVEPHLTAFRSLTGRSPWAVTTSAGPSATATADGATMIPAAAAN